MRRILITGGTGFLGARLVEKLRADNEIWVLTRHPHDPTTHVHWLCQDLAMDEWQIKLPNEIDAIVHLAQSPFFRDFPERAAHVYAVAAGATMRLLDWGLAAGAKHLVLASTGGLYGTSSRPVRENDPLPDIRSQLGFYFAAKRASELLAAQYATMINAIVLRFFFVYGSGQAPQMLMPRIARNIREGQAIYLHGERGMRLNPIHVDDAVFAIGQCLKLPESRIFNIAGPETTSLRHIAETIGRHVNRAPVFTIDETVEPGDLVADIQRMSTTLGAPRIGIDSGIAELCGALQ